MIEEIIEEIKLKLEDRGIEVEASEIENRLRLFMEDYGISEDEARRSVTNYFIHHGIDASERKDKTSHKKAEKYKKEIGKPSTNDRHQKKSIVDLINEGENETVEFKSSLRWDFKQNNVNKEMEYVVAKTISAFMNSKGGTLLIGIDDDGDLYGLNKDCESLPKKDQDGFELQLTQVISDYLGLEFRSYVQVRFERIGKKEICVVEVRPTDKPVFIQKKGDDPKFYVRAGNSSRPMNVKEFYEYIDTRFYDYV